MADVVLLATMDTKASEAQYLVHQLGERALSVRVIDLSLGAEGEVWPGERKLARMQAVSEQAFGAVAQAIADGARAVVGLGGGTGGEMILRIMERQPVEFPQVLVTTLPFDPRPALARSAIILMPTLADFSGLNGWMRDLLDRCAAMLAGLVGLPHREDRETSVAISVLGATQLGADQLSKILEGRGISSTFFHANGYGGAALSRLGREGRLRAVIDLTPHELTRLHLAGACVAMPDRFTFAREMGLPNVVLPGGLNFIGLGPLASVPEPYRQRSHYAHSGFFTHVKVLPNEMKQLARILVDAAGSSSANSVVVVPMGGFSHQDCPGGAIEDPDLRAVFLETAQALAPPNLRVVPVETHINDLATASRVAKELELLLQTI
ncbi:MAG: Tm-1-like ATP-binding domain-containing protein [Rhizobiales bacterium]|nr:Tm-1-like ATP-binding domain-containing protein [Hyphomicrobiales bacterium]